jgi:hypothetical protein
VAQHLLHAPEIGSALQQMGRKGMPEQVGVHAFRLESRLRGQASKDEERAGPRQRPASGVEEELRPVAPVEVGATMCQIPAQALCRLPADRDEALLGALPETQALSSSTASVTRSPPP